MSAASSLPKFTPYANNLPRISRHYPSALPLRLQPQIRNPKSPKSPKSRFEVFAEGGDEGGEGGEVKRRRAAPALNLRWRDVLDPDPENIVAIGLTGLLTWASVQVLSQILFISIAILLAALKYSFIAALLLFILITLL